MDAVSERGIGISIADAIDLDTIVIANLELERRVTRFSSSLTLDNDVLSGRTGSKCFSWVVDKKPNALKIEISPIPNLGHS